MRQQVYPAVWGQACEYEPALDLSTQKTSIDYWVTSPHFPGRVAVEEKIREGEPNGFGDWPDVFLEYACGNRPGWIEKPEAKTHVLLYILPSRALALPWPALREAWEARGERWKALGKARANNGFSVKAARNDGYSALGVTVPITNLMEAVPGSLEILRFPN